MAFTVSCLGPSDVVLDGDDSTCVTGGRAAPRTTLALVSSLDIKGNKGACSLFVSCSKGRADDADALAFVVARQRRIAVPKKEP